MKSNRKIKQYAIDLVKEFRRDMEDFDSLTLPAVDFADVTAISPQIVVEPHNLSTSYDEEYLMFQIDPDSLAVGDTVVLARDLSGTPCVIGKADGNNEDPFEDPDMQSFFNQFLDLEADTKKWKSPVATLLALPKNGNQVGDVRLVLSEEALYTWTDSGTWVQISGAGGAVGDFVETSGDTMTGDLIMEAGTMITLPDEPVEDSDVVNKGYLDAVIASLSTSPPIPTVSVSADYTFQPDDQLALVDASGGDVTITLPADHTAGKVYEIKDWSGSVPANNIVVVSADGDTIDLGADFTLTTQYQSVTVVSDGTNWYII